MYEEIYGLGPSAQPQTLFQGVHDLTSPVVGSHSVGRSTSGRFCRVCLNTGDFLRPQGAIPQAFTTFVGGE